jgi:hypothetical protein
MNASRTLCYISMNAAEFTARSQSPASAILQFLEEFFVKFARHGAFFLPRFPQRPALSSDVTANSGSPPP